MNEERYTDNDERNELQATQFIPDDTTGLLLPTDDRYYIEPECFDNHYSVRIVFRYFVVITDVLSNEEDHQLVLEEAIDDLKASDGFDFSNYLDAEVELIL